MPLLRVEPHLFAMLRDGFAVAACDPQAPLAAPLLHAVSGALARAEAVQLPGVLLVVRLSRPELAVLATCFEVGAQGLESISNDDRSAIQTVLKQTSRAED